MVVYDITSRDSFEKVVGWLKELKENSNERIHLMLVGNKIDLESQRQVTYDEGFNFAKANGMKFTETSAFDLKTVEPVGVFAVA